MNILTIRGNIEELAACLAGLRASTSRWDEALESLVIVNGTAAEHYRELQRLYPEVQWQFHPKALGFAGAYPGRSTESAA